MIRSGSVSLPRLLPLLAALVACCLPAGCAKRIGPDGAILDRPEGPHTITHVVGEGETLEQIADNYFGDPTRAADLATDNGLSDPAKLATGSSVLLNFSDREWDLARRRAAAMKPYNRGVGYLNDERLAQAEEEFTAALQLAPEFVGARYNLALVHLERGRHEEARKLLAPLVVERSDAEDILFAHGYVLFLQTRFADAIDSFDRLLALNPAHRRGAFSRARSLQEAGHDQAAIAAWENYLLLDATSSWADLARRNLKQIRGG